MTRRQRGPRYARRPLEASLLLESIFCCFQYVFGMKIHLEPCLGRPWGCVSSECGTRQPAPRGSVSLGRATHPQAAGPGSPFPSFPPVLCPHWAHSPLPALGGPGLGGPRGVSLLPQLWPLIRPLCGGASAPLNMEPVLWVPNLKCHLKIVSFRKIKCLSSNFCELHVFKELY